jgi:glycosyltransferase involved in cell wall biosynthesis
VTRAVTLVVPAHGRADELHRLLAEVDRQARGGSPLPVVVADDASDPPLADQLTAGSYDALALDVVRAHANRGPGAARNLGLARVRTPWVAFVDSDEIPAPGWLARLDEHAADPSSWPALEGAVDDGGIAAGPFTHAGTLPEGSHLAGNLVFRTELLRRLGGFDERFYDARLRLHFREDTELFFRLEAAGTPLRRDATLVVHHPPHAAEAASPLRAVRRYHFDPLLARLHPERFRQFNRRRRVGPVPLRVARHTAAVAHVGGVALGTAGALRGSRGTAAAGAALAAAGWLATVGALGWRRRVQRRDVPAMLLVGLAHPWVYVAFYYAGAVRFRHLPRL